jgi:hypothetical protein
LLCCLRTLRGAARLRSGNGGDRVLVILSFFFSLVHPEFMKYDPVYPEPISVNLGGWRNESQLPNSTREACHGAWSLALGM